MAYTKMNEANAQTENIAHVIERQVERGEDLPLDVVKLDAEFFKETAYGKNNDI